LALDLVVDGGEFLLVEVVGGVDSPLMVGQFLAGGGSPTQKEVFF